MYLTGTHAIARTVVSFWNTHAHYYTVLCSLHFKHLRTDKQIKCDSVLLFDNFLKGTYHVSYSKGKKKNSQHRPKDFAVLLCTVLFNNVKTIPPTLLCASRVHYNLYVMRLNPLWCTALPFRTFSKPVLWFLHNPLPCGAATYLWQCVTYWFIPRMFSVWAPIWSHIPMTLTMCGLASRINLQSTLPL